MAAQQAHNGIGAGYRRASRKNAPKRFLCDYPGCDKVYTRAEHLQRHQLNHVPKQIFRCEVENCDQKFVRADLLARHQKRHSSSYTPRNRMPSSDDPRDAPILAGGPVASLLDNQARRPHSDVVHNSTSGHHATPIAAQQAPAHISHPMPLPLPAPTGWSSDMANMNACNIIRPKTNFYQRPTSLPEQAPAMQFANVAFQPDEISRDNFAMWLFDPQANYSDFNVAHLPFLEGGLESTFNSNIHYDYESLASSRSQLETPPWPSESDEAITELRHRDILALFQSFLNKQPKAEPLIANLVHDNGNFPALNVDMMRDCLQEYWEHVSTRMPIVHQPTFSCNRCPIFLLMIMIALGAASLRSRDASGNLSEYGGFADIIIQNVRWEIMTAEEASPPVALWVAQALLLLEFYEKLYSSRKLHERAHIYHTATLTLLRRGSPLIGRSGSESPPEVPSADNPHGIGLDSRTWWMRWAETEAMHRIVFAAFMMDVTHAAMFGHAADMAPHEIRLPLPCDESLWVATSPEAVRQGEQNLRMYGVRSLTFLDGLKQALHGNDVKTHSFGRMIIMSGLLSVGWHLTHRETHLKWLDLTTPASSETQDVWKRVLLRAFDEWKTSFDTAQGAMGAPTGIGHPGQRGSNGPIQSAAVLYHLAHISLHVDIVDCQVYAGVKRLLGRKVSTRDFSNVVTRMQSWAALPSTRHAVLHAFYLLFQVLVDPRRGSGERADLSAGGVKLPPIEGQTYTCHSESDLHRPWIMYYAALCIWCFVRALSRQGAVQEPPSPKTLRHPHPVLPPNNYRRVVHYLSQVAHRGELTEKDGFQLVEGLPDLLDGLRAIFREAHSELLKEADERLRVCRDMLETASL